MHKLGYITLRTLMRLFGSLPMGFHHACAGFIAWLLRDVLHYRRDIVMTNLARSFPDRKYKEITRIADRFYRHLADIIVETIWLAGCRTPRRFKRQSPERMLNPEVIADLYEKAPAVLILNSHCGNWEFFGAIEHFPHPEGTPHPFVWDNTVVVYKRVKSVVWDELMHANRITVTSHKDQYDGYVETGKFLRYALTNLAAGKKKIYNFNTDQHPYSGADSVPVGAFMHQPTDTMMGGVRIAHKYHMAVAYMNVSWESRGHYLLKFEPVCEDAASMDPLEIMKQYYALLQRDIEAQPWNYLWSHKRWK